MEIFRWVLPTAIGQEWNYDDNYNASPWNHSDERHRRTSIVSSEQRTLSSFQENDDNLFEMEHEQDTLSDHSLVILERQELLQEFGITLQNQEAILSRAPSSSSRSSGRFPPPNTPISLPAIMENSHSSTTSFSFSNSSHHTFLNESISSIQKDLPTFIKNISSYPISHIFAACFAEELELANRQYLDENGDVTVSSCDLTADLNEIQDRMDLLYDSISFLESVVPIGR